MHYRTEEGYNYHVLDAVINPDGNRFVVCSKSPEKDPTPVIRPHGDPGKYFGMPQQEIDLLGAGQLFALEIAVIGKTATREVDRIRIGLQGPEGKPAHNYISIYWDKDNKADDRKMTVYGNSRKLDAIKIALIFWISLDEKQLLQAKSCEVYGAASHLRTTPRWGEDTPHPAAGAKQ